MSKNVIYDYFSLFSRIQIYDSNIHAMQKEHIALLVFLLFNLELQLRAINKRIRDSSTQLMNLSTVLILVYDFFDHSMFTTLSLLDSSNAEISNVRFWITNQRTM